ncbi:MAG: YbaB/EbfC family nucleoid-associated protein [Clostridiales bacterium]|nr:YbaB/EbfC family nucleoid-associated protein [Candidatus Apopatocola equi]MCQ2438158.1 YbaB/EbfC family nucleoid-associated protein [Oscillospiraceae bacterium]
MAKGGGFRGGFTGGAGMNQANMLKKAQQMQQEMLKMQQELETKEFSATAGGGAVEATVSGKQELLRIRIDPDAVDPEDVEMLQDMVVAAVNEALRSAAKAQSDNMSKLTGGMNLPF